MKELKELKDLRSMSSVVEFIRKVGLFAYLTLYQLPNEEVGIPLHGSHIRGILKDHFFIYREKIQLWEKLHGLEITKFHKRRA